MMTNGQFLQCNLPVVFVQRKSSKLIKLADGQLQIMTFEQGKYN